MYPVVKAFMAVWFGGLFYIFLPEVTAIIKETINNQKNLSPLCYFFVMLLFSIGLVKLGKWLRRDEEKYIVDFIHFRIFKALEVCYSYAKEPKNTGSV